MGKRWLYSCTWVGIYSANRSRPADKRIHWPGCWGCIRNNGAGHRALQNLDSRVSLVASSAENIWPWCECCMLVKWLHEVWVLCAQQTPCWNERANNTKPASSHFEESYMLLGSRRLFWAAAKHAWGPEKRVSIPYKKVPVSPTVTTCPAKDAFHW